VFKPFSAFFLLTLCFNFTHGGDDDYVLIKDESGKVTQQVVKGKRLKKQGGSSWLPNLGLVGACSQFTELASLWSNPAVCKTEPERVYRIINAVFGCGYSRASIRPAFPCLREYRQARTDNPRGLRLPWDDQVDKNGLKLIDLAVEDILAKPDIKASPSAKSKRLFFPKRKVDARLKSIGAMPYFEAIKKILAQVGVGNSMQIFSSRRNLNLESFSGDLRNTERKLQIILNRMPFNSLSKGEKNKLISLFLAYDKDKKRQGFNILVSPENSKEFFEILSREVKQSEKKSGHDEDVFKIAYEKWRSKFLKKEFGELFPPLDPNWERKAQLKEKQCWTETFSNFHAQLHKNPEMCANDSERVIRLLSWGLKCNYTEGDWRKLSTCLKKYATDRQSSGKIFEVKFGGQEIDQDIKVILDMALDWILNAKKNPKKNKSRKLFISQKRLKEISSFKKSLLGKAGAQYDEQKRGYYFNVKNSYAADLIRNLAYVELENRGNIRDDKRVIESDQGRYLVLVNNPDEVADIYQEWWETYFTKLEYPDHPY
jgi:hypothetical protein